MQFDPKDLEALAGALISKGAPILGGIVGGPFGALIGAVVPQIAEAFGLPGDAPAGQIASTVAAAPDASDKLSALEERHKVELEWAKLQVEQNNAELQVDGPPWLKFYYGGWRPAMGWLCGPILMAYVYVLVTLATFGVLKSPLTQEGFFSWFVMVVALPIFAGLAGLRTYERSTGVALDTLPIKKK